MAVSTVNIGKYSYQICYEAGDKFSDVITSVDNIIKQLGYTKIDEDADNGDWAVWKKTAYDKKTSYCIRLYNNSGKVALELYEDWDTQKHTGKNNAPNSIFRPNDLNGNQRYDADNGGVFYLFVSDKWLMLMSKTPVGIGDIKWGSFTGVFERERKSGETPDLYNYPPVVYLCAGQMDGGWGNANKVGYVRVHYLGTEKVSYSDEGSWSNGIHLYNKGYPNPDFAYKDDILNSYPAFNIMVGINVYMYGRVFGLKQIAGKTGQFLDIAVIKCDKNLFGDDNGTDIDHWIIPQGNKRFAIPK